MDYRKELFTVREAQDLTGASYRQLSYWQKSGLVVPKDVGKKHSYFGVQEIAFIAAIVFLKENKFSVQNIRSVAVLLQKFSEVFHKTLDCGMTIFIKDKNVLCSGSKLLYHNMGSDNFKGFNLGLLLEKVEILIKERDGRTDTATTENESKEESEGGSTGDYPDREEHSVRELPGVGYAQEVSGETV